MVLQGGLPKDIFLAAEALSALKGVVQRNLPRSRTTQHTHTRVCSRLGTHTQICIHVHTPGTATSPGCSWSPRAPISTCTRSPEPGTRVGARSLQGTRTHRDVRVCTRQGPLGCVHVHTHLCTCMVTPGHLYPCEHTRTTHPGRVWTPLRTCPGTHTELWALHVCVCVFLLIPGHTRTQTHVCAHARDGHPSEHAGMEASERCAWIDPCALIRPRVHGRIHVHDGSTCAQADAFVWMCLDRCLHTCA